MAFISQPAKTSSVYNAVFSLDTDIPMSKDLTRIALDFSLTITDSTTPTSLINAFVDKVELLADGSDPVYTWRGADLIAWHLRYNGVLARNEQVVTATAKRARFVLRCPTAKAYIRSSLTLRVTFFSPVAVEADATALATSVTASYEHGTVKESRRLEYATAGGSATNTDVVIPQKKGVLVGYMTAGATEYMTHHRLQDRLTNLVIDADWGALRALQQEPLNTTDAAGLYVFVDVPPMVCTKDVILRTTQSTAEAFRLYTEHVVAVYRQASAPTRSDFVGGTWVRPLVSLADEADQLRWLSLPMGTM